MPIKGPSIPADSSPTLKEHIKASERLMLTAYFDPVGVPTIGWGNIKSVTSADVRASKTITRDEAERLFEADLDEAERGVRDNVLVSLSQNQFDALVDFVFNCGVGNFKSSTLLTRLNAGLYDEVPIQLMRWTKGRDRKTNKMVELPGLVTRRKWEVDLWRARVAAPDLPPVDYKPGTEHQPTVIPATGEKTSLWGLIAGLFAAIFSMFGAKK